MARKQITKLAQVIALVNELLDTEKQTVADLIRLQLQPATKRKGATKKKGEPNADSGSQSTSGN